MNSLMKWRPLVMTAVIALAAMAIAGCSDDEPKGPRNDLAKYDSEVVTSWFGLALAITKAEALTPSPVPHRLCF